MASKLNLSKFVNLQKFKRKSKFAISVALFTGLHFSLSYLKSDEDLSRVWRKWLWNNLWKNPAVVQPSKFPERFIEIFFVSPFLYQEKKFSALIGRSNFTSTISCVLIGRNLDADAGCDQIKLKMFENIQNFALSPSKLGEFAWILSVFEWIPK